MNRNIESGNSGVAQDLCGEFGNVREISLFPGETLRIVTQGDVFARKEVPVGVLSQLEDLLEDDHIWESLKNQSSNDPDQQFDNFPAEYERAFPVANALRNSGAGVLQVFDVALNCARSSTRRTSDEFMRFRDAKTVTIEFKKFADRHLFETVELRPGQLEELIDKHYYGANGVSATSSSNRFE